MKSRIAPARRVAFDLLLELGQNPLSHSDDLLRSKRVEALSAVDRNLVTALVMGVLRWRIALQERIAAVLNRGKSRLADPVLVALELGAFQLLLLDRIPAHAAIFDSVELTKASGNLHAAGLVNAVLRKLAGSSPLVSADRIFASAREIAGAYAHPLWMVERWVQAYGPMTTSAICRFNQSPPPTTIRLLVPSAEAALNEEGIQLEAGVFVERARRVAKGDVTTTVAFAQGLVRIQDEGSQLIAELAGRGNTILDCCAAPGGKTAILAQRNPGASVTACEISRSRLKAMQRTLGRQPGTDCIGFRAVDATELPWDRQFDLVLCDAPCSGTGTLARNPEIRHRLVLEDLGHQQDRQIKLLSSAMRSLLPRGHLVYSTCSLEAEENEAVVHHALRGQVDFRLESWRDRIAALEEEGILHPGTAERLLPEGAPDNFLRTFPGIHPCDGFFGALITRDR